MNPDIVSEAENVLNRADERVIDRLVAEGAEMCREIGTIPEGRLLLRYFEYKGIESYLCIKDAKYFAFSRGEGKTVVEFRHPQADD